MTFKEELKNISDEISFKISISSECDNIKDKMRGAAFLGIRSFQIELVKVFPGMDYDRPMIADNYHVIIVKDNQCSDDYKAAIFEFLQSMGFKRNDVEVATITNSSWCDTSISVRW